MTPGWTSGGNVIAITLKETIVNSGEKNPQRIEGAGAGRGLFDLVEPLQQA